MKTGSIDLSSTLVIPKEGYFKPNGRFISVAIKSTDLGAASLGFTLKGRIDGGTLGFGTMQENGADIAETLASGVTVVRTFEVDDRLQFNLTFDSGTTGNVSYEIFE